MDEKKIEALADGILDSVSGGVTKELIAAYACVRGEYGNGQERVLNLTRAGYDPIVVQRLVNGICAGYDKVALEVINGKYGVGSARVTALTRAGYNAADVQNMVNHILLT